MKNFKENLLVQFSTVSFLLLVVIALGLALVLSHKIQIAVEAPNRFPGALAPQGALAAYPYAGPPAPRIADLRRWVFGSIGVGFIMLYGGLMAIGRRAWRTINRQQATLTRTNADLRSINGALQKTQDNLVLRVRETETRADRLRVLAQHSQTVTATLDPQRVFDLIIRASSELLDAAVASVWTLEDDRLVLRAAWEACSTTLGGNGDLRPGEGVVDRIAQHQQPLLLSRETAAADACLQPEPWPLPNGIQAFVGVPLRIEKRCLGVLTVGRRSPSPFGADDVELLSIFANQAAVAVENARLYRQLKDMTIVEERERIAREMHDGLAQQIGYLYLEIRRLEMNPGIAPLQQDVRRLRKAAAAAYEEIRQAIFGLTRRASRGLELMPTLTAYLREFGAQANLAIELDLPDNWTTKLSAYVEIQLLRIIQEALGNVRKHAHATQVWVSFGMEQGLGKITIRDNGRGFDPEAVLRLEGACFGLQSMQDRALCVGGRLQIDAQQGQGTQVLIWLPMDIPEGTLSTASECS